eukprot:Skav215304  [mRNA]  locus=scaffold3969:44934:56343:+ [translate_table: standard]
MEAPCLSRLAERLELGREGAHQVNATGSAPVVNTRVKRSIRQLSALWEGMSQAVTGAVCTWRPFQCLSYSDSTLRLWQGTNGCQRCHVLIGHTDLICKAEVCWDQETALSWSDDSTLKLWDLKAGPAKTCLHTLRGHVGPVWAAHLWLHVAICLEEEETRNLSAPSWIGGAEVDWERCLDSAALQKGKQD